MGIFVFVFVLLELIFLQLKFQGISHHINKTQYEIIFFLIFCKREDLCVSVCVHVCVCVL